MNYTDRIEAYTAGKMSALEQLVFEQELTDNGSLMEAFEAHQLTEALLGFTANNLSEAAILGDTPVPQVEASNNTSKTLYYGASLLALCLIALFAYSYTPSSNTIAPPTIETKQAITTPITKPSNQSIKETVIFQDPIQEVKSTPIPKKPTKVKTKTPSKPRPIAAIQKKTQKVVVPIQKASPVRANLSSKVQIQKGENVSFTAVQSITFEPGFEVEAGGSLDATIEDKAMD